MSPERFGLKLFSTRWIVGVSGSLPLRRAVLGTASATPSNVDSVSATASSTSLWSSPFSAISLRLR